MTEAGREKLRRTALRHRPWEASTGPKTDAGKARSAANGRARQRGAKSVRDRRAELADVQTMIQRMRQLRKDAG